MENFKNFASGGLFQAGRRMAPPWGSYRRFTNSYMDAVSTIYPYGRGEEEDNDPTLPAENGASAYTPLGPISSHVFRMGILQYHARKSGGGSYAGVMNYVGPDDVEIPIMQPFSISHGINFVNINEHMAKLPSGNLSACTVARKAYMASTINENEFSSAKDIGGFTPKESYLLAFDGMRVRGAGLPRPWKFCSQGTANGAHYARAMYITIGMDAELIVSGYNQLRLQSNTVEIYLGGYSAYPATKLSQALLGESPSYRAPNDHLFEELNTGTPSYPAWGPAGSNARYFDKRFIQWMGTSAGPTVVANELVIEYDSISSAVQVGDWIQLAMGFKSGTMSMFQVKSIDTVLKKVVMEDTFKELDNNSVVWIEYSFAQIYTEAVAANIDLWLQIQGIMFNCLGFTNIHQVICYSTSESSGYVTNAIYPVFWDTDKKATGVVLSSALFSSFNGRNFAGVINIGGLTTDWYDFLTVKTTFPPMKGITNYKELLVGFDANALYFSDITLGGSTEMVGGLSNLVPNGSEFGDIVAICGTEDFLLISRERRNFILTGDIASSSFNIAECDQAVPGAYNSRAVTNAWSGQAIFSNDAGVFSVSNNGNISDIGAEIKGLFRDVNRDQCLFDKTIFKDVTDTRADGRDGVVMKFFLEDVRGFVGFFSAKAGADLEMTGGNMLIYNTVTKKWYEFEALDASTVEALYGTIRTFGVNKYKEDGVMRGDEKQLLVTQWMTIDVPSLEKQVCQLKLFGEITPKTSDDVRGLTVGQQSEWQNFDTNDRDGWETNVTYTPEDSKVYFHKQRLNTSKPLATSIILESLPTGSFTLDGMEVEGAVIQQGMKK